MTGTTMSYKQVRDILDVLRSFHRQLRDALEQVRPTSRDRRTQFLLESIRHDEQAMNVAIAMYQRHGGVNILQTWIQYIPDEETRRLLNTTHFTSDMSPEEMLSRKTRIDKSLADLYRQLAGQTSAARVAEFFDNLARHTDQRLLKESWSLVDDDFAPKS